MECEKPVGLSAYAVQDKGHLANAVLLYMSHPSECSHSCFLTDDAAQYALNGESSRVKQRSLHLIIAVFLTPFSMNFSYSEQI